MINNIRTFVRWWNRPNKTFLVDTIQTIVLYGPLMFMLRTWGFGLYQVPTGCMEPTMLVGERFVADKFTHLFLKPQRGEIITFNEPVYNYSKNPAIRLFEHYVWGPENWTKRVIGIPGDHIEGKIENGKPVVYLNGTKLDEPYVNACTLLPVDLKSQTFRSFDPHFTYEEQPFYKMDPIEVQRIQKIYRQHGIAAERISGTPVDDVLGDSNMTDTYDVHLGKNQYWMMGDNRLGSWDSRAWGPLDESLIHGKMALRFFSLDSSAAWAVLDLLLNPISFWGKVRWSRCLQFFS